MSFKLDRAKTLRKKRLKLYGNYFIPKAAIFLIFDFCFPDESQSCVLDISLLFRKNQNLNLCIFSQRKRYTLWLTYPML